MEAQKKKIFHFRPLFYSFLALTFAISCAKFIFDGKLSYIFLVCGAFVLFFVLCLWQKSLACFLITLAVFGFGLGWYFVGLSSFRPKEYEGELNVVAHVSDNISYSQYGGSCYVVLKNVKVNGKKAKNIYATLTFSDADDIKIGDEISFSAELSAIKPFQLGSFNNFYYRNNVGYTTDISASQLRVLKNKMTVDERIRQKVKTKLAGMKNAGVCYAVLFGDKNEIADDVRQAFTDAGVVHLLTVSGLHISFLIALLGFLLKKCKVRGWANLSICTVFVLFYAFLCGFTPSVVRAGIMGIVLALSSAFGKRYDGLSALGLAGCVILFAKPLMAFDLGFLMSFFCVLSFFLLSDVFKRLFEKFMPEKVAAAVAVSLSAQVGIFPFVLQFNERVNFLSVFSNLFIVPLFSIVYPLLFVSVLIVLILPFMSFLLKVCDWGFVGVVKLAEFFGETKMTTNVKPFNIFVTAFGILLAFSLSKIFMVGAKAKVLCGCLLLCLSCVSAVLPDFWDKPQTSVSVCFEYSKGVILLTNSSQESVIIDVGSQSFTNRLLRSCKVDDVEAVFVVQSPRVNIETVRKIGCEKIIRTGTGEGYAEEQLVNLDEEQSLSGFDFKYWADKGKMIGLEISFDEVTVFVARQNYTALENFEEVGKQHFDLVVLGKLQDCQSAFQKTSNFAGFYAQKEKCSSYEEDGNMKFLLKNKQFVGRCLD